MKLPAATPYADHLLVWVDPDSCERTESGLYIPDWQPGDKDATVAVVAASPLHLSPERGLEFPDMDGHRYAFADLAGIPQRGALVFLRPNTFRPEMEVPDYPGVFVVSLDRVVASVGDDDMLVPFQGLLLCEDVYDDDVQQQPDGTRWRTQPLHSYHEGVAIVIDRTLITEVDPLPIPGCLRILLAGPPLRGQPDTVAVGDVVSFHRMAFANHARRQDDIPDAESKVRLAVWEPRRVRIGDTVYAVVPRQLAMGIRSELT